MPTLQVVCEPVLVETAQVFTPAAALLMLGLLPNVRARDDLLGDADVFTTWHALGCCGRTHVDDFAV
jgi:hypothetical protein